MFSLRLEELPLPTGNRETSMLLDWICESLCLVRKRSDGFSVDNSQITISRLMREFFLENPNKGHTIAEMTDSLGISAATLHHHLSRLQTSRLVSCTSENTDGGRVYFLRGGSLLKTVELLSSEAKQIFSIRMEQLSEWYESIDGGREKIDGLEIIDDLPLRIWIKEPIPLAEKNNYDEKTLWMADLGLLGDRPGRMMSDDSVPRLIFDKLITSKTPLSIDEILAEYPDAKRSKIQRTLECFRSSGIIERIPRLDLLPSFVWNMLHTQFRRRGDEWLLNKGGLIRLIGEKKSSKLIDNLNKKKCSVEDVELILSDIPSKDKMLLLNLLGGKLPLGYRMIEDNAQEVSKKLLNRLDQVLRRLRRVSELLEQSLQ